MLKIKDVEYFDDYSSGCETCDYGSSYVSNIDIVFEDDTTLSVKTDQMYEYMFSESDYMRILSNSESICEIVLKLLRIADENGTYGLEDISIKINDKKLNLPLTYRKAEIIYKNK